MADVYDIGEPESSEHDSVSLTSTVESDGEDKEYEVDRILAESIEDGVTSYLTQWTGYPETMSTWQLINTFIESGNVFKSWKEKTMRVTRGYEKAFDIDAWERRRDEDIEKANHRRERRARKKARLNRQMDALPSDTKGKKENTNQVQPNKNVRNPVALASSESSSEDDEARSPVRRDPGNASPKAPWTNEEQKAFMKGLQDAKGPHWNDILAWYGGQGSINRLLKEKSRKDMLRQLEALRKEFTAVGRDPPDFMGLPQSQPVIEARMNLDWTGRRQNRAKSAEKSDSGDSGTSIDSMLAEIREKETAKGTLKDRRPGGARKEEMLPGDDVSKPSKSDSAAGSSHSKALKKESSPPRQLSHMPKRGSHAGSSHSGIPKRDALPTSKPSSAIEKGSVGERSRPKSMKQAVERADPAKHPYSGTARATTSRMTTDEPVIPKRSRVGVVFSGPARLPISVPKPQAIGPSPQSRSSGIDVTANWGTVTEPKTRKAVTLPTTNAATGGRPPGKLFNLSVRNVVLKGRKNEPVPKLAGVVLLDPKTGRPPKPLPASSAVTSVKTPFQKHQEELAAKEAEERHVIEIENAAVNDRDSQFVGSGEFSTEAGTDEQVRNMSAAVTNTSSPDRRNSTIDKGSEETLTPRSHSPPQPTRKPSQDTGPPPNAPVGPREGTESLALPPWYPNIHPSASYIQPTPTINATGGAVSLLAQALQPASYLPLTLIGNPAPQERRELWGKTETDMVYGDIKIGPVLEHLGRMKLMGAGWYVKKLLLANKTRNDPRDMGLEFKKTCTVAEYQNYMYDVSCSCLYHRIY